MTAPDEPAKVAPPELWRNRWDHLAKIGGQHPGAINLAAILAELPLGSDLISMHLQSALDLTLLKLDGEYPPGAACVVSIAWHRYGWPSYDNERGEGAYPLAATDDLIRRLRKRG